MQTRLAEFIKDTPDGVEAEAIIRSCVHCGFCLATCPTYQLLGDELDSPRGRIYLMKQVLEGRPVTQKTQQHLDRCLTCQACETTCPSGVKYGRLIDISRGIVEQQVKRTMAASIERYFLRNILPKPVVFKLFLRLARMAYPLLPDHYKKNLPINKATGLKQKNGGFAPVHERRMLLLDGCVQSVLSPGINRASVRVLDRLGISLVMARQAGCCGAIAYHLNAQRDGLDAMRRNIDAWWPEIEQNKAEAIVTTASGCGVTVKEYGHLLRHDPAYAEKAARIAFVAKDISEILVQEQEGLHHLLKQQASSLNNRQVSFHAPCTLQHGMRLSGSVEKILVSAGFKLTEVENKHLCCGSAGTYAILQSTLSQQLLKNKVAALEDGKPDQIATANIGCLIHLQNESSLPVRHWIELLDERLSGL